MLPKPIVLIVEDEEESRETLQELLELEGYPVQTAANGKEALERLDGIADACCIMLLDLFMPVMDGWQLVERLRADGRLDRVRIVVTTSASHQAPAGFPVFEKPLDLDKLLRTVGAIC
ncbi:MAG TPA: response regulator [Polyangia bacterium]